MSEPALESVPIGPGLFTTENGLPRLLGSRCPSCRGHQFPAQATCGYCGAADSQAVPLSDRGTLYLFTVVRNAPPGYRGQAPYGFGVVELPEGIRIVSPLTESRLEMLRPGMPVQLVIAPLFRDDDGREILSYAFTPELPPPSPSGENR